VTWMRCERCEGLQVVDCPDCLATGFRGSESPQEAGPCSTCDGSGKVPCPGCLGTGYVDMPTFA